MDCILKEKFCKTTRSCADCNSKAKKFPQEMKKHPRLCAWINCKTNNDFTCINKSVNDGEVPDGDNKCIHYKFVLD